MASENWQLKITAGSSAPSQLKELADKAGVPRGRLVEQLISAAYNNPEFSFSAPLNEEKNAFERLERQIDQLAEAVAHLNEKINSIDQKIEKLDSVKKPVESHTSEADTHQVPTPVRQYGSREEENEAILRYYYTSGKSAEQVAKELNVSKYRVRNLNRPANKELQDRVKAQIEAEANSGGFLPF
jgi:chromosome segregation ATPase